MANQPLPIGFPGINGTFLKRNARASARCDGSRKRKRHYDQSPSCHDVLQAEDGDYQINFIDTPGHVDFSYEVPDLLLLVKEPFLSLMLSKACRPKVLANVHLALERELRDRSCYQ